LLEFRKVYLRAIAEAWADSRFFSDLTNPQKSSLEVLEARFPNTWPWKTWDLKIVESPSGSYWDNSDHEWIWPSRRLECITIYLPLDPGRSGVDDQNKARALADYYLHRPSLFGDPTSSSTDGGDECDRSGDDGSSGGGGLMPADKDFLAFRVALMTAMAKAWDDPSFSQVLTANATTALNRVPGYKVPWDFTILVKDDVVKSGDQVEKRPQWIRGEPSSLEIDSKWSLPVNNNVLTLYLPNKPEGRVSCEAVALAMYNATGAKYPFTCTC
jgi:ribosomally synthesized peptide (two-chain TOMM family)